MGVPITSEQVKQLQDHLAKLVSEKEIADTATETSKSAHLALQQAQTDVSSADADEAAADTLVSESIAVLQTFVGTLAGGTPSTPTLAK